MMNRLIEKLKSLDKKIWIGVGIALVVVIAVVVTLVLVLGGSDAGEDNTPTSATTSTSAEADSTTNSTDGGTKTSTTKKGTTTTGSATTTTASGTTTAPTASQQQNSQSTNGSTPGSSNNTTTTVTDPPITTDPDGKEIVGSGTASDPYLRFPNDDMTVRTLNVPAGKSLHYNIYRVGGMILTINNANAYVVHEGTRYNANGGKVTVQVVSALASDAVSFEIGNSGSSAISFTLSFANQAGSYMNPVKVSSLSGNNSISLPEGHDSGYYYKYTAEKNGTIRFYMTATSDSVMLVTNNSNSAQRTSEDDALTDSQGNTYIELEVQAGDEIIINVGAKPNKRGKYAATDITWNGTYA